MDTEELGQFFSRHWQATIERCQETLDKPNREDIVALDSLDAVRKSFLDQPSPENAVVKSALSHLNTFVDVFESKLSPKLSSSFFWGSLGILIQTSSQSPQATRTIQRVLRAIGYKADSFNTYVAAAPAVSNKLKECCFDMQVQLLEFFIDAIKCMRGEYWDGDHRNKKTGTQDPLGLLEKRFLSTNTQLDETLARVERLTQFSIPLHTRHQTSTTSEHVPPRRNVHLVLPQTRLLPGRFFNRTEIFEKLDRTFGDAEPRMTFKAVTLLGLAGIGKSSVAMRYVETKIEEKKYDAIFWVHGEKQASLRQSFTDIAIKLKLPNAGPQNHDENLELVLEWLQSSQRWLVIYDNVSKTETLRPFWPGTSHGHVIITTRSPSLACDYASTGVEVASWDPQTGSDFLMFLLKKEIGRDISKEGMSALELSKRLSGHALGITHMAGMIHRGSWSIADFMRAYLKNPPGAHKSELQALWEYLFKSLEPETQQLLGVLAFLMPDNIPQTFFEGDGETLPDRLRFCCDEFRFSETVGALLEVSLIKRNRDTRVFSTHRMIQTQFRYFLDGKGLQQSFDDAATLVCNVFPKQDDERGQLYEQWVQCNSYLQHAIYLKDCFKECRKEAPSFNATSKFCLLLVECQRYLFETNQLEDLEDMCEVNLMAVKTLKDANDVIDVTASTLSHLAQMYESLGRADKAVELNKEGLELRFKQQPPKLALIAGFENNLGCAYSTANDHYSALASLKQSLETWNKGMEQEGKPPYAEPVITANIGRCQFYLNRIEEARQEVNLAIAEFRKEKPLNWGGLAYAFFVLGTIDRHEKQLEAAEAHFIDAQNTWRQGENTRLHPFNGGCMYKISLCCLEQGKTEAAVKHLQDSLEVTRPQRDKLPMEHGRNLLKLSEALTQDSPGDTEGPDQLLVDAETYLKKGRPDAIPNGTEESYDTLINIAWR